MSPQLLENAPTDLLWMICSHLESPNRLGLHSLSMVNKRMRSAVQPILFSTIKITMRGEDDLKRTLAALPPQLALHLRQLVIQGWIPGSEEKPEDITAAYNDIPRQELHRFEDRFAQPHLSLW